jgi:hypothetical protein
MRLVKIFDNNGDEVSVNPDHVVCTRKARLHEDGKPSCGYRSDAHCNATQIEILNGRIILTKLSKHEVDCNLTGEKLGS